MKNEKTTWVSRDHLIKHKPLFLRLKVPTSWEYHLDSWASRKKLIIELSGGQKELY